MPGMAMQAIPFLSRTRPKPCLLRRRRGLEVTGGDAGGVYVVAHTGRGRGSEQHSREGDAGGEGVASIASPHQEPSLTSKISSATSPCASRCTVLAASADGASTRQKICPLLLVDPVAQVVDVVLVLRLQVGHVGLGDVVDGDSAVEAVDVHVERHRAPPSVVFDRTPRR